VIEIFLTIFGHGAQREFTALSKSQEPITSEQRTFREKIPDRFLRWKSQKRQEVRA
jgi:hypothetical protein